MVPGKLFLMVDSRKATYARQKNKGNREIANKLPGPIFFKRVDQVRICPGGEFIEFDTV